MKSTVNGTRRLQSVVLEVRLKVMAVDSHAADVPCPDCEGSLNLHQPDESLPGQLLATCEACASWFTLHEHPSDQKLLVMVEIAGPSLLQSLLTQLGPG